MAQNITIDNVEIRKRYYKSGALWWETPYVNGKKHGIEKFFYRSGTLERVTPYVNGKKHGTDEWFYESGALWVEIPYVTGRIHGIAKHYDKDNTNIDCLILYNRNCRVSTLCLESYRGSSM